MTRSFSLVMLTYLIREGLNMTVILIVDCSDVYVYEAGLLHKEFSHLMS